VAFFSSLRLKRQGRRLPAMEICTALLLLLLCAGWENGDGSKLTTVGERLGSTIW
jgi:hypothetical protein